MSLNDDGSIDDGDGDGDGVDGDGDGAGEGNGGRDGDDEVMMKVTVLMVVLVLFPPMYVQGKYCLFAAEISCKLDLTVQHQLVK